MSKIDGYLIVEQGDGVITVVVVVTRTSSSIVVSSGYRIEGSSGGSYPRKYMRGSVKLSLSGVGEGVDRG